MKIFVFLLLAINILFFALFGGFWQAPPPAELPTFERLRIIAQKDLPPNSTVNPEKISENIDNSTETPAEENAESAESAEPEQNAEEKPAEPPKTAEEKPAESKEESKTAESPQSPESQTAESPAVPDSACIVWANLSNEEALSVQKLLVQRFSHLPATVTSKSESSGRWRIFIPPLPDADSARARARTLKNLGVDHFVFASGENKNAISLGVFSQEKSARAYFEELKEMGIKDAILQFRASTTTSTGAITDVRVEAKNAAERARVVESVKRVLPNKDVKACP